MANRFFNALGAGFFLAFWTSVGLSEEGAEPVVTLRTLGAINRPSVLEPAGSHGSVGFGVGAGGQSMSLTQEDSGVRKFLGLTSEDDSITLPRAWVTKGTPLPVDLGITGAATKNGECKQVSGYLQWTVYEALAMPAFALRGSYGRLVGDQDLELASTSADAVLSYGFFRYFTIFGSFGNTWHQGSMTRPEPLEVLALAKTPGASVQAKWQELSEGMGIRIALLPPIAALSAGMQVAGERRALSAKLAVDF